MDREASNLWLRRIKLIAETERFVVSTQENLIGTRNRQKYNHRYGVDEKCWLFRNSNESIKHIIEGCKMLAQRKYAQRHKDVCEIIH